ncbi:MAG TPA: hypothetical protein VK481_03255 [Gemmatimonadaceae bacterium]|nr:hypothetical protein [Gemmatimonadaceae bacterium]
MAYQTDRTWVSGEHPTNAMFNVIRDNLKWLSTDKPMCRVTFAGGDNLNFTHSAWNDIVFGAESFDNAAMHSIASATERVIAQAAGKFLYGCTISWSRWDSGSGTAGTRRSLQTLLNGATVIAANEGGPITDDSGGAALDGHVSVLTCYSMAAADYFGSQFQDNATASNLNSGATSPFGGQHYSWAMWVGI